MSIDKLKNKFFTGAWLPDSKHYFKKINEIIDRLNGVGTSGDGSYKVYSAIISQLGTDAPTAIVLQNTIGNIVWSRTDVGQYYGTLVGAFTVDKTGFLLNTPIVYETYTVIQAVDIDSINLTTTDGTNTPVDEYLSNVFVEIRVYN